MKDVPRIRIRISTSIPRIVKLYTGMLLIKLITKTPIAIYPSIEFIIKLLFF